MIKGQFPGMGWMMIGLVGLLALTTWGASPPPEAGNILEATGIKGGLIVHLGCGDGTLTLALRTNDHTLIQGLDADETEINQARDRIISQGVYGPVSFQSWNKPFLPYMDNLVNLLVVEEAGRIPREEMLRVLCPRGILYLKQGSTWTKTIKPRPGEIDEWTHYLHDAGGNAVAHDTVVAPPRHYQWIGSPKWARHHDHMASMSALVSTVGASFISSTKVRRPLSNCPPNGV